MLATRNASLFKLKFVTLLIIQNYEKNQETIFFSRRKWEKILFVMKLKLILILISSFQLSAAVYSQGNKVTLKMENTLLEQVIWEIQ